VVERRVEGVEEAPGSTSDADPSQPLVPATFGALDDGVKAKAWIFRGEVCAGILDADEGDADAGDDGAVVAGVKGHVGAGVGAGLRVGRRRLAVARRGPSFELPAAFPGSEAGEGSGEDRGDVDPVARALPAEEPARRGPVDLMACGVDLDGGEVVGLGAAAGVDQDAGVRIAGEGEARHPGAGGRGQLGFDRAAADRIEADRVVPRPATLTGVREAGLELAVERGAVAGGRALDRLGRRQEGEIAVERAACTGEVGEAEALDVGVAVVVAAAPVAVGRRRIGAPLDHAKGSGRTGEVVAAAEAVVARPGAGEDVHAVGKAGRGCGRRDCCQKSERGRGGDAWASDQDVNVRHAVAFPSAYRRK
jgi:hypothetical protein